VTYLKRITSWGLRRTGYVKCMSQLINIKLSSEPTKLGNVHIKMGIREMGNNMYWFKAEYNDVLLMNLLVS
jgi:hypothetical protein